MTTFHVTPQDLRDLHGRLARIKDELTSTGSTIEGYHGELGSADIDNALDGFFSSWSNGMNRIESHMKDVLTRLAAAADNYEHTDQAIGNAIPTVGPQTGRP